MPEREKCKHCGSMSSVHIATIAGIERRYCFICKRDYLIGKPTKRQAFQIAKYDYIKSCRCDQCGGQMQEYRNFQHKQPLTAERLKPFGAVFMHCKECGAVRIEYLQVIKEGEP